jgi:signal transduction histidine kinase
MMSTLRVRFAVMLATAAVVPLLTYGAVSLYSLGTGTTRTVVEGNLNVARRVAEQVHGYISANLQVLQALAADIDHAALSAEQTDRILKNYVLRFRAFRELTMVDPRGRVTATSRLGRSGIPGAPRFSALITASSDSPDAAGGASIDGVRMTRVFVDGDLLPTALVGVRVSAGDGAQSGWIVGEFSIEELWRMVGRIHIGATGYAQVIGADGELLAHGDPAERPRIAVEAQARADGRSVEVSDPLAAALVAELARVGATDTAVREGEQRSGERMLAVGARIADLGWTVIVSQPVREAYAVAPRLQSQLMLAIGLALLVMVVIGSLWGRAMMAPITALITGTRAIAAGRLDERVAISSKSELGTLGSAFNSMADRLVDLQDNVRRQERHAMFGRVAAGLVHDLSHPFKNIQNNCRLMLRMHDDPEYRALFGRTVDREFSTIRRVFEDLRNIARPMPLERFPVDVVSLASEVGESMRSQAASAGVALVVDPPDSRLFVNGDRFALGRVVRNLVMNAIEATPPHGTVSVSAREDDGRIRVTVTDTGCGIPTDRMATMFEDFSTTKRQGLGLGLAIVKKIVEQLDGTVGASSVVGRGTTFVLEFASVPQEDPAA